MSVHLGAGMNRRVRSTRLVEAARRRDEGAILTLTLVLMVFGALIVGAILTFTLTVLRARPPLDERTTASETVRSAIRAAIHQQRVAGADGCFRVTQNIGLNGLIANVTCTVEHLDLDNPLMRNRFGVVTTANVAVDGSTAVAPIYGAAASTGPKTVTGNVFINAGAVDASTSDIQLISQPIGTTAVYAGNPDPNRYTVAGVPQPCGPGLAAAYGVGAACIAEPWTSRAGYSSDAITWTRPPLPPLPTTARTATPMNVPIGGGNTCKVFFPGRYTAPLTLDSGQYYFTSGVYYFEAPITISGGARVIAGEGSYAGCLLDADAALYVGPTEAESAPKNHAITGHGATFLLGGAARLNIRQGSLLMNRRLSFGDNRATEGVSIRSVVTTPIETAQLSVPADVIDPFDGVGTYPATTSYGGLTYTQSTATWNEAIVDVDFTTGGSPPSASNRIEFRVNGMIYVPNAKIEFRGTSPYYATQVLGGITATRLGLQLASMPDAPDVNYYIGTKPAAQQTLFRFDATVVAGSGMVTKSSAMMQLNIDGSYAVNTWTLDTNTEVTTPSSSTTTTTLPPTTTTTLPPTTTTTLPPTTTTTTVPVAGCPGTACRIEGEAGTRVGSDFYVTTLSGATMVRTNPNGSDNSQAGSSYVQFTFNVTEAGTYEIWGRTYALDGGMNSFWVRVDGQPTSAYRWNTATGSTYVVNRMNNNNNYISFNFSVGTHTVRIYKREAGTGLDWIELRKV
jgi:hypothetical protein